MEKQLPVYEIYGTMFLVEVERYELRKKDGDADDMISFCAMDDKGSHYELGYDRRTKTAAVFDDINDTYIVRAVIPPLKVIDPEGMAAKYGYTVEELEGKTDFEIMVDQQALKSRLAGTPPVIDIAGHPFNVDWSHKELWPQGDMGAMPLELRNMKMNSDGTAYICPYHIPTKSVFPLDLCGTELPKDVVMLEIPYEFRLDPVGTAREYGMDETFLLKHFPIEKNLKAKVTPLSETDLPKRIEFNSKKMKHHEARQPQRKGTKIK